MYLLTLLRRGDVVRVRLDPVQGSEQAGERPVLILSPDIINAHSPVLLVAPLTSRKTSRVYPFEALVDPPEGGLRIRTKVLLLQMRAVDKNRLRGRYGSLAPETMRRVAEALKIAAGLVPCLAMAGQHAGALLVRTEARPCTAL